MVSNARLDLPEPETPVTTVSWLCGISQSMFLRLWTRAPRTTIDSWPAETAIGGVLATSYLTSSRDSLARAAAGPWALAAVTWFELLTSSPVRWRLGSASRLPCSFSAEFANFHYTARRSIEQK